MKGLYGIPLGVPFLQMLARGLIAETKADPVTLARYLIILPTRRSCLALHHAFIKEASETSQILPRMMALPDLEEGADLPDYLPADLPPAMPEWQRLGLLTHLILTFDKGKEGDSVSSGRAVRLAQDLMRFVDEVETAGLHLDGLKTLVGTDHAAHWQLTLDFLKILTDLWPSILEQSGFMEPAKRRRIILDQIATHWHPSYPVILAGTRASRPATASLAKTILTLEKGRVILPGVDFSLKEKNLPSSHPQYTLNQFVQKWGSAERWPYSPPSSSLSLFLSKAMMTAPQEQESLSQEDETQNWHVSSEVTSEVMASLQAIEAPSVLEEAKQIALIMRYELETPANMIALVTPDTELSKRVQAELRRWDLKANVSHGLPLTQTVVGRFLRLTSCLVHDMSPSDLLALLKHPLCRKGSDRLTHLAETRQFEREVLRGQTHLQAQTLAFPGHKMCEPLLRLSDGQKHPFVNFLKAHKIVAESLVGDEEEENISSLWTKEDGRVAHEFLELLFKQANSFPPLTAEDYPSFLHHLMRGETVRDVEGIGSRLLILGTLEARLVEADVVILGGLNEGTWPGAAQNDPWLSRSMRDRFGLPSLEHKVGLSCHDFCAVLTAPKVYMTRSLKRNGAVTISSRWWQRFSALLSVNGHSLTKSHHPWQIWSQALDKPESQTSFKPPAPCPPLVARPRRLSVTDVEKLMRDPYSIYAKHILRLRPLDPLEMDLSMMERGQAIHQVLDAFIRSGVSSDDDTAMVTWETLGKKAFEILLKDPRAMAFWWPRFQRMGRWFLDQMTQNQHSLQKTKTEIKGSLEISTTHGPVILTAKADRIDYMTSGQGRIIDYKTGSIPPKKEVMQGYAPQLSLEGLILEKGGFSELSSLPVEKLEYWHMTGGNPPGEVITFSSTESLIREAEKGVESLFEAFLSQETPFYACPDPLHAPSHHDYAHLERLKEWAESY